MALPLAAVLAVSVAAEGVRTETTPSQRFPSLKPGDLLRAALEIQSVSERGDKPAFGVDPFTGDFVVSQESQAPILQQLLLDRAVRTETLRQQAESPPELLSGAPFRTTIDQPLELRDIVVREFNPAPAIVALVPESPRATRRQISPGVVNKGNTLNDREQRSGPCAGRQTGLTRLRCGEGGFT